MRCHFNVVDDSLVPTAFHLSDMGQTQGTNDTPLPPFKIRKERCPGYEVNFITKYKLSYWKLSVIKNHILTWKPIYFQLEEALKSNEYWIQKLPRSSIYNTTIILRLREIPLSRPSKFSIALLTDREWHFHLIPAEMGTSGGEGGGGGLGAVITHMGGLKGVYGTCVGVLQPLIVLRMTG